MTGLDAIGRMWEKERQGPDEIFTLATSIVAVDGPVAVVRAEVSYGDPVTQEYRDLWVIRFMVPYAGYAARHDGGPGRRWLSW